MKEFFNENLLQIIATLFILILMPIVRYLLNKLVNTYSGIVSISRTRTALTKRILGFTLVIIAVIILATIWGVKPQNIFLALSSVFAVIGVALFAQWSVLSNITAGFILFFSLHLKIGDKIRILDKDFPTEAEVEDIKSFYIYLRGENGEKYVYPNNQLLQKGITILSSKNSESEDYSV